MASESSAAPRFAHHAERAARAMSAISSAESWIERDAQFSSRCSGRLVPGMGSMTGERARSRTSTAYPAEDSGNPPGSLRVLDTTTGAVTTVTTNPSPIEAADWLTWDQEGHLMFPSGQTMEEIDVASGAIILIAGLSETPGIANGLGPQTRFTDPAGVVFEGWYGNPGSRSGGFFVADNNNDTIRVTSVAEGSPAAASSKTSTFAGLAPHPGHADGAGTSAFF